MSTAFDEDKFKRPEPTSYENLKASANHALANGDMTVIDDSTFTEKVIDYSKAAIGAYAGATYGATLGATAGSIVPGAGTALGGIIGGVAGGVLGGVTAYDWRTTAATTISAINQVYNSGVKIMNIIPGVDAEEADIHNWMGDNDSSLNRYYDAHKEGIDAAGFVVGSIPAGLGAVKVYNYAAKAIQAGSVSGIIGAGTSEASGLLIPTQVKYLQAAKEAAMASGQAYNFLEANAIKGLLAGAGEQAIQGAVFELGAQVALNASPLLSNEDTSDVVHNMWTASWTSGLIGGGIGAISHGYQVTKKLGLIDKLLRPAEWQEGQQVNTRLSDSILNDYINQANLDTKLVTEEEAAVTGENAAALNAKKQQMQARTNISIDNDRRLKWQQMVTGKDAILANMLHETLNAVWLKSGQDLDTIAGAGIYGLSKVSRLGTVTDIESKAIVETAAALKAGKTAPKAPSIKILNLWGEKLGQLDDEVKTYSDIWSHLPTGKEVEIAANGVKAGSKFYEVSPKKIYSALEETDVAKANARTLFAMHSDKPLPNEFIIGQHDTAFLEKALFDMNSGELSKIKIAMKDGSFDSIDNSNDLLQLLAKSKREITDYHTANNVIKGMNNGAIPEEAIASLANVKLGWMNGTGEVKPNSLFNDIHALQSYKTEYAKFLENVNTAPESLDRILLRPQQAKLIQDTDIIREAEQLSVPFSTLLKQQQVLNTSAVKRAVAMALGEKYFTQLPEIPNAAMRAITRAGAGPGRFTASQAAYGTAEQAFGRVGQIRNKLGQELDNATNESLHPIAYKLMGDEAACGTYSATMSIVGNTPHAYIIDPSGKSQLILKEYQTYLDDLAAGKKVVEPSFGPETKITIPVNNEKAFNLIKAHTEENANRLNKFAATRALGNNGALYDGTEVYAPPLNTKDFPFFAFVTDPTITSQGHTQMIWAKDAATLEKHLSMVPEEFQAGIIRKPSIVTGPESEKWHKAIGDYNRDDALTDNYLNAALKRSGAASQYLPPTKDRIIVDHLMDWHYRQNSNLLDESIGAFYGKEFQELRALAERWDNTNLSAVDKTRARLENKNPFRNTINIALDKTTAANTPPKVFQDWADRKVSEIWATAKEAASSVSTKEELDKVNKAFQDAGINHITYDSLSLALANQEISRGALSTAARRMNSIVAGVGLGWDMLNAVNNRVGSIIMLAPEVSHLLSKIRAGDAETAGELSKLADVIIPESGGKSYFSTTKLIGRALGKSFDKEAIAWASEKGFDVRHVADVADIVDTLALSGQGYKLDMDSKITLAFDKFVRFNKGMAKMTGNLLAESQTRLTSALVMKELTDLAVARGVISESMADTYIQTFVNRTNGVYLASQRPLMFAGPIGQMMGLYQTYMTSMYSMFFRHINEGSTKSAAMMMGLQGSIYGMSSMPGFNAINTYLVGQAAGNPNHRDIYGAVFNSMDKEKAEWLMYGGLSNAMGLINPKLKMNMYTRGDANPRNVSIVPLNPADWPAVSISAKFFGNAIDVMDKIANGGNWGTSILQGLEHNGISRPLSGLAQSLQSLGESGKAYSTTNKGSLIAANDLFSFVSVARLAGAKPLDEAMLTDKYYRNSLYKAKTSDQTKALGEAIKSKVINKKYSEITDDDFKNFARDYVRAGGKQEGFNKFFNNLYKDANASLSNRMSAGLKSQEAQDIQRLMGGIQANDFMTTTLSSE